MVLSTQDGMKLSYMEQGTPVMHVVLADVVVVGIARPKIMPVGGTIAVVGWAGRDMIETLVMVTVDGRIAGSVEDVDSVEGVNGVEDID
jgi:hypothetical protein